MGETVSLVWVKKDVRSLWMYVKHSEIQKLRVRNARGTKELSRGEGVQ